ncbi:MAG: tol-pal system YbgF family protein, partial [Nitrospiria bacterium]
MYFFTIGSAVATASDFVATPTQSNPAPEMSLDVSEEQAFLDQAKMNYMRGKYEVALSSLERFIRSHSKSSLLPDVYLLMSEIYSERSELENVVKYLTFFIDRFPNEPRIQDVQMRLSGLYFRQGALKKVLSLWESIPGEVDSKRIVYGRLAKIH